MRMVKLADAKARLSELVEQAAAGETVCLTKRGNPVAQITAVTRARKPVDTDALRVLTSGMRSQTEPAGDFVRRMRDEDRY